MALENAVNCPIPRAFRIFSLHFQAQPAASPTLSSRLAETRGSHLRQSAHDGRYLSQEALSQVTWKIPWLYIRISYYIYTYVYIISYYSASYPPTPANARWSAPGNKTFGCLCTPCSISTAQQQEGHVWHSFSTVSDDMDDTLGSFWATFCRCSVLHCHCVSLSGRAAFAALAALGSSINSSQAPVHHGASAQHSSRKAMFDTVLLRF